MDVWARRIGLLACGLLVRALAAAQPAGPSTLPAETKYLAVVQRACNALLENARDNYGEQHSGMIISLLDRQTGKPLLELVPPTGNNRPPGVRETDDVPIGGCNTNLQLDLYRCFVHLSRLTGDPRYADAARQAMVDFMRITQNPKTGLLAWGEHLSWDCLKDKIGAPPHRVPDEGHNRAYIHEPKRKFLFYNELLEWNGPGALNYARGLWEHQICDQKTGDFSRHAAYDKHEPGSGFDFQKEGSYFIDTWSQAYAKTHDDYYANAVRVLATRYLNMMNDLNLLDSETGRPERKNWCMPEWMLSLAMESADAAGRMDPQTAELLRKLTARLDDGFLRLDHAPQDPKLGFLVLVDTSTGKARPYPKRGGNGYSRIWGLGYGTNSASMLATLCYTRQGQLGKGDQANAYRKLVLAAAKVYQQAPPDTNKNSVWAGEYGLAIFAELAAYRLTDEAAYLDTARKIADSAIDVLWEGGSPLPRASWGEKEKRVDYYDAVTYPDTLILSLLALHEACAGLPPKVEISDLIR